VLPTRPTCHDVSHWHLEGSIWAYLDLDAVFLHVLLCYATSFLGKSSRKHHVSMIAVKVDICMSVSILKTCRTAKDQHTTTITLEQLLHGILPASGKELISLIDDGES
jgi:guanyl-specific ribonuclease Sa